MQNTNIKRVMATILCCILILQTGCWDQKIYERIGFILQLGLELDSDGNMIYTISVPLVEPEVDQKTEILSTSINLLREGREQTRLVSGKNVEAGKTQHLYFSKELAQHGINQYLDIFFRSTENPLLSNIVVVDGSPKEMMEWGKDYKARPRQTFYINDLLEDARRNSYAPETRTYDFSISAYSTTIDPIAALLRYNKEQAEISGSALFSKDKMVGEINAMDTSLLLALMNKKRSSTYFYQEKNTQEAHNKTKSRTAISFRGLKRTVSIDTDRNTPEIHIRLRYIGIISEYHEAHNLDDSKAKKELEEKIAESMRKDLLRLLHYLQTVGADPIGFGEMIRTKHNTYWKSVEWRKIYEDVKFSVEVDLLLEFYGAMN